MNDEIARKIGDALDSEQGLAGHPEIAKLLEDPENAEYARHLSRMRRWMASWPLEVPSSDAFEALASRIDAQIGQRFSGDFTRTPDFDDEEPSAGASPRPKAAAMPLGQAKRLEAKPLARAGAVVPRPSSPAAASPPSPSPTSAPSHARFPHPARLDARPAPKPLSEPTPAPAMAAPPTPVEPEERWAVDDTELVVVEAEETRPEHDAEPLSAGRPLDPTPASPIPAAAPRAETPLGSGEDAPLLIEPEAEDRVSLIPLDEPAPTRADASEAPIEERISLIPLDEPAPPKRPEPLLHAKPASPPMAKPKRPAEPERFSIPTITPAPSAPRLDWVGAPTEPVRPSAKERGSRWGVVMLGLAAIAALGIGLASYSRGFLTRASEPPAATPSAPASPSATASVTTTGSAATGRDEEPPAEAQETPSAAAASPALAEPASTPAPAPPEAMAPMPVASAEAELGDARRDEGSLPMASASDMVSRERGGLREAAPRARAVRTSPRSEALGGLDDADGSPTAGRVDIAAVAARGASAPAAAPAPSARSSASAPEEQLDHATRASGGGASAQAAVDAPRGPVRETLDRETVQAVMLGVEPAVRACAGDRHGTAQVDVVVQSSGRVSTATVTGTFQGSAEGSCIARAVRSARFPAFSGEPLRFRYPFGL